MKVNPGTSRKKCVWRGDHLKVNLTAPPEDGRANRELTHYIAEVFGLKPSDVTIKKGKTNRNKILSLTNLSRRALTARIRELQSG